MKRIITTLLFSLYFTAVSLLPHHIVKAKPFCGNGFICIYDDPYGTSLMAKKYWTDWTRSVCYGMSVYDNRVSYVVNDSDYTIVVYLNNSCSGTYSDLYAHSYGPMNAEWNNSISSWFRP